MPTGELLVFLTLTNDDLASCNRQVLELEFFLVLSSKVLRESNHPFIELPDPNFILVDILHLFKFPTVSWLEVLLNL